MKLKKKYLHIELSNGNLSVFADDKSWGDETFTLDMMDRECLVNSDKPYIKIKIPLKDFIEE